MSIFIARNVINHHQAFSVVVRSFLPVTLSKVSLVPVAKNVLLRPNFTFFGRSPGNWLQFRRHAMVIYSSGRGPGIIRHSLRKFAVDKPPATTQEWDELKKLSLGKRLKVMFKKYWYIALPMHCANCAVWFALLFILAKCGINGAQLINWVKPYITEYEHCPDFIRKVFEKDADKLGHLAVALLLYKLMTPARYATTVFLTVYMLQYLLRRGVLVKSAKQQMEAVRSSYLTYAVSRNIQRHKERLKKNLKSRKPPKPR